MIYYVLQQVSELVGSVCMGLADLITDGITYSRLQHGDIVVDEGYKAAYVSLLCFGGVTTLVALAYRLHNVHLVRAHLVELGQHVLGDVRTVSAGELRQQVQRHEWELQQTHRTKVILSLSLLSIMAQGALPLRAASCGRQLGRKRACDCNASRSSKMV